MSNAKPDAVEHVKCKALTICQPYAHLICLPGTDPRHKRVENREWFTRYRGPLLIHAGKSRAWMTIDSHEKMDADYEIPLADMAFGAIIGRCTLVDCLHIDQIELGKHDRQYPWLREHQHTSGTYCWALADVSRLPAPIPWSGAQGLWDYEGRL